jgi:hypothetical protein
MLFARIQYTHHKERPTRHRRTALQTTALHTYTTQDIGAKTRALSAQEDPPYSATENLIHTAGVSGDS